MTRALQRVDADPVSLRELADDRPLIIMTGSLTCPMTISALQTLTPLAKAHRDALQLVLLNVREGHPGERITQPKTMAQKLANARRLHEQYAPELTVLIDDIDGPLHQQLDTKPNSLHIISSNGQLLYRALFANASGVRAALKAIAKGRLPPKPQSQSMMQPVLQAAGYFHEVFKSGGRRAMRDVAFAAPPMLMLAVGTRVLFFVQKPKRGPALMLVTMVFVLVIAGFALVGHFN